MTHYLRFPDQATGMAALAAADLLSEEGTPITGSHIHALDVVGSIAIEDGATPLDGWHINYIGELPAAWAAYEVHPSQPVRVFAN
jgi:hypothetical protein